MKTPQAQSNFNAFNNNPNRNAGSVSKISNNSMQVEDAYGGLLTELQDVRQQLSQYVEGGSDAVPTRHYSNINKKIDKSLHVRSVSPLSNRHLTQTGGTDAGGTRFTGMNSGRSSAFVINEVKSTKRPVQATPAQTRVKSRRAKKIKEYRERFLEEREVLLADLEQRLSRDSARSARTR